MMVDRIGYIYVDDVYARIYTRNMLTIAPLVSAYNRLDVIGLCITHGPFAWHLFYINLY